MPAKLDKKSATERVSMTAPKVWLQAVDKWRRKQAGFPNRSHAIRQLVLKGIEKP